MQLRPYQLEAINNLRSCLAKGNTRPVLQAATGSGKTVIAGTIINSANIKGHRALFVVDTIDLVDQAVDTFQKMGLDVGVMQGIHELDNSMAMTQVCTAQTLAARIKKQPENWRGYPVGLILIDECFVGETKISTPRGKVEIRDISVGDFVFCATGIGKVIARTKKKTNSILKIGLSDGTNIECTRNHPFFTDDGWVKAEALGIGSRLFSQQDMCSMWQRDETISIEGIEKGRGSTVCERERAALEQEKNLLSILREEITEPHAQAKQHRKDGCDSEKDWSQAKDPRRKWQRPYRTSTDDAASAWGGLGSGEGCDYENQVLHGQENAESLQTGSSKQNINDRDRDRRRISLLKSKARTRREEGFLLGSVRVESIEDRESDGDRFVYNIEVQGHPSYFAENVLVHNCHVQYAVRDKLSELYPRVPIIGLSATPFTKGMGKFYNDLVVAVSMQQLIDDGFLKPFRVFAPDAPDLTGVKMNSKGDYDSGETQKRFTPPIIANIVKTWMALGEGRPTIGFAVNVAMSKAMAEEFVANGINAEHVDGYGSSPEEKQQRFETIEKFKAGKIDVLWNVGIATKGFDAPRVSCIIDASPTKSLSLFVQKWGRGTRTLPDGDKDCIVLDHSGNVLRSGLPPDIIITELDDGTKGNNSDRKPKDEPLPKPCKKCNFIKPPKAHKCPNCGFAPEKQNDVEVQEGELVAFEKRGSEFTNQQKLDWMYQLNQIRIEKGYKKGWAIFKFKSKFGEEPPVLWPKKKLDPTPEVLNWIKHEQIKFAKGRAKHVAA